MKKILFTLFLLGTFKSFGMELKQLDPASPDSIYHLIEFEDLSEKLFYISEFSEIKVSFSNIDDDFHLAIDNDTTNLISDAPVIISDLSRGDHTLTLFKGYKDKKVELSKTFKLKDSPPYISNDAVVLGILLIVLLML